jgi:hypothetical protein
MSRTDRGLYFSAAQYRVPRTFASKYTLSESHHTPCQVNDRFPDIDTPFKKSPFFPFISVLKCSLDFYV